MDAKATGAFIAQLRKEKNYTQKELAQLLNVSDKAISRWETGKGFPDTALLQPLSQALGITVGELLSGQRIPKENMVQKTEQVLVSSMKHSGEQKTLICVLCGVLALILLLCAGLGIAAMIPPSAIEFVNKSNTTLYYRLGENAGGILYPDFASAECDGGTEYWNADGTRRFLLRTIPEISSEPVLAYQHISGEGMLFGFAIGQNTIIQSNADLGVTRTSLRAFLEENGFAWQHGDDSFGRPSLIYIDGERCNWYPYAKDNVLINICISAHEGCKLMGFDIGLIDESMGAYYSKLANGFPLTLKDPDGLVTEVPEAAYPQWEAVTITAKAPENGDPLYLFMGEKLIGKFTPVFPPDSGLLEFTFSMPGAPTTIRVTTQTE